jgi:hypothetical protein
MTLADYFAQNRYQAKYQIGDRVIGQWNKIPFVGTVGNDTLINEKEGPHVTIHVDLPIMFDNKLHNVIIVKHKDIKTLKEINLESKDDSKSTDSKTSSKKPVLDSNRRVRKSR